MMKNSRFGYQSAHTGSLFYLCWVAYVSTYICRLNFSAVMPELLKSNCFTQSEVAAVSSAFFICYGLGQFFSGGLGDKVSPRLMVFLGIMVSAISNILIFFFHASYWALLLLWAVNGAVQSMVWSPLLHMAGDYFSDREKEKFAVDIATTIPIGTLASYGVSLLTLLVLPWHCVFLVCGVLVLGAALYWMFGTRRVLPQLQKLEYTREETNSSSSVLPIKTLTKVLAGSGVLVVLGSLAVQGTLQNSIPQWIPTFFDTRFQTGTGLSLLLTMVLPIVNFTGAYLAKAVNRRLRNELSTSAFFFAVAVVFLSVLFLSGGDHMVLALVCMAGVTNCMFAVNVMLITMVPLRFSRYGRASTVGGFLNAMVYIGCGLMNLAAGALLDKSAATWTSLFILWLLLGLAGLLLTGLGIIPWKRFLRRAAVRNRDAAASPLDGAP